MAKEKTAVEKIDAKLKRVDKNISEQEQLSKRLQVLAEYDGDDAVVEISEILEELREDEKLMNFDLSSGFIGLDEIIGSFREGQLVIISAPTGHGKTTFSKTLTKNFQEKDMKSLWFSYEVPPLEFAESFPGTPAYVVPRTLQESGYKWIEKKVIEGLAKYNSKVVFIDHLHYLVDMKQMFVAKSQSILIGHILRELKKIALECKVVIFLIAHMRKTDLMSQIPTIDDLRDSSFIAQEADIVLLLWRKQIAQSAQQKRDQDPVEWLDEGVVSVVKNRRTGKLGYIKLQWQEGDFIELRPLEEIWNQ